MILAGLIIQWGTFALMVGLLLPTRTIDLYHPLSYYLLFHFIVFVLRPTQVFMFSYHLQFDYMGYYPDAEVAIETLAVSSLGLIAFTAGSLLSTRVPPPARNWVVKKPTHHDFHSFMISILVMSPLLLYSIYLHATQSFSNDGFSYFDEGGIELVSDPETGRWVFANNTAYLVLAITMVGTICLSYLWLCNYKWYAWIPLSVYVIFRMSIGSGRFGFVILTLSVIMQIMYARRRRMPSLGAIAVALVTLAAFSAIGENRRVVSDFFRGQETISASDELAGGSFGDVADFANYDYLTFVVAKVPQESGTYSYFTQYLELFTKPIPRIFWKDKPIRSPIEFVNLQKYGDFSGRTPSAVGDAWISLGWVGVLGVLSVAGFGLGALYTRFFTRDHSPQAFIAYFAALPLVIQWARDGGTSIPEFLFFVLSPLLVWSWIAKVSIAGAKKRVRRLAQTRSPAHF